MLLERDEGVTGGGVVDVVAVLVIFNGGVGCMANFVMIVGGCGMVVKGGL